MGAPPSTWYFRLCRRKVLRFFSVTRELAKKKLTVDAEASTITQYEKAATKTQYEEACTSLYNCFRRLRELPPDCPLKAAEQIFEATTGTLALQRSEIHGPTEWPRLKLKFLKRFFHLRTTCPTDAVCAMTGYEPLKIRAVERQLNFILSRLRRERMNGSAKQYWTAWRARKLRKKAI